MGLVACLFFVAGIAVAYRNLAPLLLSVPTNPLPFNSNSWKAQRLGNWPERGAFRSQMRKSACDDIKGMPLTSLLLELGPPDWLGEAKYIPRKKDEKSLQGNMVLAYFLDPKGESWLCISVYPDSNFESCFETSMDDGH